MKFEELNISQELLQGIKELGYEEASPIQEHAIPFLVDGRDVIGQAQTGTGKTAAFGIPMLETVEPNQKSIQGLVLCPTRELCVQVSGELAKLSKYQKKLNILPIYGGVSYDRQLQSLKRGSQIIVATPGRMMDLMRKGKVDFGQLKFLVLDEADEMFDMGFREDMEFIIEKTPSDRQTAFFSATMDKQIMSFSKKFQNEPEVVKMKHKELTVTKISQYYLEMTSNMKTEILSRLVDIHNPKLTIVFCNTKRKVDELTGDLQARGYDADGLHGDLKQSARDSVMKKFKGGTVDILIATDVAARGLDINDVDLVINYDLPQNEEYYVHRIGRTARAGRSGIAYSFVVGRDIYKLEDIQKYTKAEITYRELPTLKEIRHQNESKLLEEIVEILENGDTHSAKPFIDQLLLQEYSSVDVATALWTLYESTKAYSGHEELDMVDYGGKFRKSVKKSGQSGSRERKPRIFINKGSRDGMNKKVILGAFGKETNIPKKLIGNILVFDNYSFVELPRDVLKKSVKELNGARIAGKVVEVEISENKGPSKKGKKVGKNIKSWRTALFCALEAKAKYSDV